MRLERRPWTIGWQFEQGRGADHRLFPEINQALQRLTVQVLLLPLGKITVLHRKCRQRWARAFAESLIASAELAIEDRHRPAVGGDMMHHQHQRVFRRSEAKQSD